MNYDQEKNQAEAFFNDCLITLIKKANDYASDTDVFSNFKKIALMLDIPVEKTFLMFIVVKVARIVELIEKPAKNESLDDSLKDIANYSCLMDLYLQEKASSLRT